jgi:hypothetical protein
VTVLDPHVELRTEFEAPSLDSLVADCAEVSRHLAEVPRQRAVRIPERAVALVAGLDSYGD